MSEYNQYQPPTEESVDEKLIMGVQSAELQTPEGEPIVADFSAFEDINEGRAVGMDMPRTANKSQMTLELDEDGTSPDSFALYGEGYNQAMISGEVFQSLGRPSKIDVTVRPHNS